MAFLENRIPPPLVLLITIILIVVVDRFDSKDLLQAQPQVINTVVALAFAVVGFIIALLGVREFRQAQTTVNPLQPERATQLVTSGMFGFTRNPMYLGMASVAIGAAIYSASIWAFLLVATFVLYISRFQIIPEERAIEKIFGSEFTDYCQRTRRWL